MLPDERRGDARLVWPCSQRAPQESLHDRITVQRKMLWALADTVSTSTLVSEEFYNNLPFKDPIAPHGNTVILAGNGTKMDLKRYTLLQFDVYGHTVYHKVGVVSDLGLDFILGASFLKAHGCT